ncbi:hypothetical protein LNQ81_13100 [Myroides sp. M-43]|uniref:hypothetical protein n=1 Tax=Myroides oncorhynchi TaxID=2893756 RepID=UPI001E3666EA|nr:hypothetical protein [Myroides oncorhynchi]MCC9043611.1 hypothetical protein [Myroides oncorhynchi]
MKKIILLMLCVMGFNMFGQVGINTSLPLKPFHIDAKKDNPPTSMPTADQEKNDVVVDQEGRLGIGTINPSAKLDLRGNSDLQGNVNIGGVLSLNNEIKLENRTGEIGSYLMSQGAGKAPKWYVPKASEQGDIANVKSYSFMMLDGNGNSTVVNVDELFQSYLKTLVIPSVEIYASSVGTQRLNNAYNKINVFESILPKSKFVGWNTTDKCIDILEDGRYLLTLQIGVSVASDKVSTSNGEKDMLLGFTQRDPSTVGSNVTGLWVGRGVFRFTKASSPESRTFTTYSTLLELKKGNKIYPAIYVDAPTSDNVTLEGVQKGSAGDGVLTNLNVTKY